MKGQKGIKMLRPLLPCRIMGGMQEYPILCLGCIVCLVGYRSVEKYCPRGERGKETDPWWSSGLGNDPHSYAPNCQEESMGMGVGQSDGREGKKSEAVRSEAE